MRIALPLAVLALSACVGGLGGGRETPAPTAGGPVVPIRLDANGIEPVGTGLRIDFGRHGPGVIDTVGRLQGRAPVALLGAAECGQGRSAARWADGLTLVFRDDAFRGWAVTDPARSASGALSAGAACAAG
jgi:hypothetical protein